MKDTISPARREAPEPRNDRGTRRLLGLFSGRSKNLHLSNSADPARKKVLLREKRFPAQKPGNCSRHIVKSVMAHNLWISNPVWSTWNLNRILIFKHVRLISGNGSCKKTGKRMQRKTRKISPWQSLLLFRLIRREPVAKRSPRQSVARIYLPTCPSA